MYDQPPAPCSPEPSLVLPPVHSLTSLTICEGAARGSPCTTSRPPVQPRALVGVAPCAHSLTSLTICEGAARGSPCTTSRPPRAAPSPRAQRAARHVRPAARPVQPRALVGVAPCAHSLTSLTICEGASARLAMYDQPPAPCSPEPSLVLPPVHTVLHP
ncbi:hypothetical protein ACJJTC_015058 [Scirpophaga incertulas]